MTDAEDLGPDGLPVLPFADQPAFERWLAEHQDEPGLWLRIPKKATGVPTVSYIDAVLTALCYGWIDGKSQTIDERWYRQRFTPRKARSRWSEINVGRIAELTEAGRMQPRGLAEVEKAKADGRWDAAYASPSAATVPDDLQAALDADPAAREFFGTLTGQQRYTILYRIDEAKRAETRARRIAEFVRQLAAGTPPR
jgi:uncharacterized protein YdeI (YjbR/CyaY-like superfamily)